MAAARRGTRTFLRQVADELPSHLPPKLRDFSSEQWGRFYKVWYGENRKVHFEVQFVSGGRLEIGLHLEADEETNERIGAALDRRAPAIRKTLGEEYKPGSHGPGWRSFAETWKGGDLRGEEAATEAAARLAEYVTILAPMLESTPAQRRPRAPATS